MRRLKELFTADKARDTADEVNAPYLTKYENLALEAVDDSSAQGRYEAFIYLPEPFRDNGTFIDQLLSRLRKRGFFTGFSSKSTGQLTISWGVKD